MSTTTAATRGVKAGGLHRATTKGARGRRRDLAASARPGRRPSWQGRSAPRGDNRGWETDAELVSAILAGSRRHFDLLYEAYFPRVYRFALKRLGDVGEAEDVAQEVFLTVFQALPSYAGESTLLVWIFGITRNKVNRRFRRPRARHESLEEALLRGVATAEPPSDETVDARRILDRCESVIETRLTPLQRRIFHLKHLRRQSIRAIAQALGKSEDAVKANLYRMRRALLHGAPGLDTLIGH